MKKKKEEECITLVSCKFYFPLIIKPEQFKRLANSEHVMVRLGL